MCTKKADNNAQTEAIIVHQVDDKGKRYLFVPNKQITKHKTDSGKIFFTKQVDYRIFKWSIKNTLKK